MNDLLISRRVFIGMTAYIVTAPLLASVVNPKLSLLMVTKNGKFFTAEQMTLLVDVAEIMIPKTDTAGATDAQVIPVLDGLMLTWAGNKTKKQFTYLVNKINDIAMTSFHSPYNGLLKSQRAQLITELDQQAFTGEMSEMKLAYKKLKEIIFHVYYTSEEANPDFMLIPGNYRGCVTQQQVGQFIAKGRVS